MGGHRPTGAAEYDAMTWLMVSCSAKIAVAIYRHRSTVRPEGDIAWPACERSSGTEVFRYCSTDPCTLEG